MCYIQFYLCHTRLMHFDSRIKKKTTSPKVEILRRGLLFHLMHENIYVSDCQYLQQ